MRGNRPRSTLQKWAQVKDVSVVFPKPAPIDVVTVPSDEPVMEARKTSLDCIVLASSYCNIVNSPHVKPGTVT